MEMIRYDEMVIGSPDQYSVLRLSSYSGCQGIEIPIKELALKMKNKDSHWIIEGDEPIEWLSILLKLLRELKKDEKYFHIKLKTNNYFYPILHGTSITDAILDLCDILIDKENNVINLSNVKEEIWI